LAGKKACLEFSGLFGWAKKRRPTLRESRSSFKEKGDKSCFTVFVLKQQACQRWVFYFFIEFLAVVKIGGKIAKPREYKFLNYEEGGGRSE
jgi:hypothetical protein